MNDRQNAILDFVKVRKSTSRQEIQAFAAKHFDKASRITILRDLDLLEQDGKVRKTGVGRAIRYGYAQSFMLDSVDVEKYYETEPEERKLVSEHFNFGVWEHLHNFLTEKEQVDLALLNEKYRTSRATLSPTLLKKEIERITIELSWKSSKIEGDTYTLLETEMLLKENKAAEGKTEQETRMILNHKKAIDFLFANPKHFATLSLRKIEDLHRILVDGLDVEFGLRSRKVGITGTRYRPLDNKQQIREAMGQLAKVVNATENPIEKALICVLMISYIQPFEDGNKRTARILANAVLMASDYCPLSYRSVDVEEYKKGILLFYEQNSAYYFKRIFTGQFKFAVETYF
jgi:Fic family protein